MSDTTLYMSNEARAMLDKGIAEDAAGLSEPMDSRPEIIPEEVPVLKIDTRETVTVILAAHDALKADFDKLYAFLVTLGYGRRAIKRILEG